MNTKLEEQILVGLERMKILDQCVESLRELGIDFNDYTQPSDYWKFIIKVLQALSEVWGIGKTNQCKAMADCIGRDVKTSAKYLNHPDSNPLPSIPCGFFESAFQHQYGKELDDEKRRQIRCGKQIIELFYWAFAIKGEFYDELHPEKRHTATKTDSYKIDNPLTPVYDELKTIAQKKIILELEQGFYDVWKNRKMLFDLCEQDFELFLKLLSLSNEAVEILKTYNILRIDQIDKLRTNENIKYLRKKGKR